MRKTATMANRLAGALSPYLQQHADNPVDWFEWGDEAFALARQRDVPVFLSVGYAACHWCHVMAHESFEDPRIARQLNAGFVSVKVDREERPDIDSVYMRATGLLTGSGGWPMSVFLDHEGRPFHAGTYFPPHDSRGMPGFPRVLATLSEVWRTDRPRVDAIAAQVAAALAADGPGHRQDGLDVAEQSESTDWSRLTGEAVHDLQQSFDPVAGGFGGAPKFPPSMVLEFLLRHSARTGDAQSLAMAEATLQAMARGGLYDQLAGGFARYSTDDRWIVPHFEKMLYDNALLARVYLHWWRATGDPLARRIAVETLDFLIDEMRTPEGGFASSLDADSPPLLPGQNPEGAFYVWTPGQVAEALADLSPTDVQQVGDWLGVTPHGNFEAETSVLQLPVDPDDLGLWQRARQLLLESRSRRSRPAADDKVVAGWNGLAIAALAEAAVVLSRPDYLNAAAAAADLLVTTHRSESGAWARVSRSGRRGSAAVVLEDLGGMADGFLALYQASGDIRWYDLAEEVLEGALADHGDGAGGFWETANSAERLVARTKEAADNATPSGWALVCGALVQLAALDGGSQWRDAAEDAVRALLAQPAARQPRFFGWGLAVVEAMLAGPVEVAVIGAGDDAAVLRRAALSSPTPVVVAVGVAGSDRPALLAGRPGGDAAVAYVCRRFTCAAPTSDAGWMSAQIRGEAADSEG